MQPCGLQPFLQKPPPDACPQLSGGGTNLAHRQRRAAPQGALEKICMWLILFVILLIAWGGGFMMFHVAGGLIHLLLVVAVISLILHFVLGRGTP
jgi:uncharacterized membrane protein (DUF485 family)